MRNWKQASSLTLAFACISALQNVSFAAEVEKPKSSNLGLEAQAHALSLDTKTKPTTQANVATELKKTTPGVKVSSSAKVVTTAKSTNSTAAKSAASSKIVTTAKTTDVTNTKSTANSAPAKASTTGTQQKATAQATKTSSDKTSKTASTADSAKKAPSNSNSGAKNSTGKTVAKTDADTKKTAETDAKKAANARVKNLNRKALTLVPPPPPTIPTYINSEGPIAGSFDLGLSVNFMSLDDLKFQRKTLEKKLEAAQLDDKDQQRSNAEKQERAKRFVELYEEGVVSRRELETAKGEAERAIRDKEQTHIKVSEIERVLGQVKERISSMQASKQPFKVSSKKSKTR